MSDRRTPAANAELGAAVADLAQLVMSEPSGSAVSIPKLVELASRAVRHTDHAGLTLLRRRATQLLASTSEVYQQLAAIQTEADEGPCLEVLTIADSSRSDDLTTEQRWPTFCAQAVEQTPVRSVVSFGVFVSDTDRAALSLFSDRPYAFDDVDISVAAMFASYLSQALQRQAAEEKVANLDTALGTSRQIGAAMGILMSRDLVTFDEAFDRLRSASQRQHRKLREVAADVLQTGELRH